MKKKSWLISIVSLSIVILAFFLIRAIVAKKNVKRPPSIEKIQEEEGVPVRIARPVRQDLEVILRVDGTVEAENKALVAPRIDQIIEEIKVDEGDPVRQGEPLVLLSREAAESADRASQTALEEAERDFQRARELLKSGAIAQQDLDQARVNRDAARARHLQNREGLRDTAISSPLSGIVSHRYQEPGELASKGKPILEIVDIANVEVHCRVSETTIRQVKEGQTVRIKLDAFPGRVWEEEIETINPTASEVSRLFDVKIKVPNPDRVLKPGMYARVEIISDIHRDALLLPRESVVENSRGREGVFLLCQGNIVRFHPVETGIAREGRVEIVAGLDESCEVVTEGRERLSDGTKVRIVHGS